VKKRIHLAATVVLLSATVWSSDWIGAKATERPRDRVPGEYLVELRQEVGSLTLSQLNRDLETLDLGEVRPGVRLLRTAGRDPGPTAFAARARALSSQVVHVEPNLIWRISKWPNDPRAGELWGLRNSGQVDRPDRSGQTGFAGVDISAEAAWDLTTGDRQIKVAVIDTGIDFTHPDLAANAFVNAQEKNGRSGVDDDQNGYIDDINGFDFVANRGAVGDDNGHGTHCAGTIGAVGDDGQGLSGVNWRVSLLAVKFLDGDGSGTTANAIKAIDYARVAGVQIMSNSWGGGSHSALLEKSIQEARDAGILFIAAAGNDGMDNDVNPTYPAGYEIDNIVSVAAINNRGQLADFSNYGAKTVHLAAPGVNILSTVPKAIKREGYDIYSGTSMATPHVAGVAALVASTYSTFDAKVVKARLLDFTQPMTALRGRVVSNGSVDAFASISGQVPPPDPNDPFNWSGRLPVQIASPQPYPPKHAEEWIVRAPGATRFAIRFDVFETERGYDFVRFFDAQDRQVGEMSGNFSGQFSPVFAGDFVKLKFSADDTIQYNGVKATQVYFE
jgi:subtilisin family serine protease